MSKRKTTTNWYCEQCNLPRSSAEHDCIRELQNEIITLYSALRKIVDYDVAGMTSHEAVERLKFLALQAWDKRRFNH